MANGIDQLYEIIKGTCFRSVITSFMPDPELMLYSEYLQIGIAGYR